MTAVLRTHQLEIGYAATHTVIARSLDLEVTAGELVCLLGPNGVGKSTLMRTLAGMQPSLAGTVKLGPDTLEDLTPRKLAARLSIVLTERPDLGFMSGYALVALGRHPHTDWLGRLNRYDEAVIRWAIEAVDAANIAHLPVMQLSDGQRQKLMIARALAQETDLILLDEPTAYLDLPRRAEIMQLLRSLALHTGRAIILSTHDLDLALHTADTLWLMSAGRINVGTPEDLVLDGTFERAFQSEGVAFDRSTGTFDLKRTPGRMVHLIGSGIPQTWTRRALSRAGYTLVGTSEADSTPPHPTVKIGGTETSPVWHLVHASSQHTLYSIRALLQTLADLD